MDIKSMETALPHPRFPDYIEEILKKEQVDISCIKKTFITDLSASLVRCESYIAATEEKIYVVSGNVTLAPRFNKTIFRRNPLKENFEILEYKEFPINEYEAFSSESMISGAVLTGTDHDGNSYVIAAATGTMKEELESLAQFLSANADEIVDSNDRSADRMHHGMPPPPHGGFPPRGEKEGKFAKKGPLFCPKCGKRFSDPRRRICVHCLDKGKILKRVWTFIGKYKFQVFASLFVLCLTSALSIITPYISSGFYYDEVLNVSGKFYGELILVLSLIIGTKLLSVGVNILNNLVSCRVAANLRYDLKNTIFESIEKLSLKYFTDKQTGSLMTQVTRDSNTIYWFFSHGIPYFLINAVQIISIAAIMIVMKPSLALLYLSTVPVIFFILKVIISSMGKYHGMRYMGSRKMNALVSDTFSGMRVVKAFSKEKNGSERFEAVNRFSASADRTASRYSTVKFPIIQALTIFSNMLVLGFGGWMVIKGTLNYGELMTFIAYTSMIYSPMHQFVHLTYQATDSLNAMGRLVEIMDAESDVKESENAESRDILSGNIIFEHVNFGYDKSRLVLKDINFNVKSGTILGVVGHTGAGKSTLANLLLRMYDVDSGEITVDGIPIKNISSDTLRKNIAIVSQETYLFVGSILDNIRYARPDASLEDVIKAAKISGAHDFIVKLPDGYSTMIGFGQRDLSGGERQRLSIARALLRDPAILILDEATAAMDTQTERKIQNALEILIEGKTTIMIAHRLSTLRMADKLIVLKDGEICESGSHDELIRAKGEYFKLYSLQLAALKNIGVEA